MTAPEVTIDTDDELAHAGDTGMDTGTLDPAPIDDAGAGADAGVPNSVASRTVAGHDLEAGNAAAADEGTGVELTRSVLDVILPVGLGLYGELMGGVTWGIPLHTGGRLRCQLHRIDADHVDIQVYKQGKVGFDSGAGASVFIGLKSSTSESGSKQGGVGVGADAGVNLQAGTKVEAVEHYVIPVENLLTASLGFAVIQIGIPAPMVAALTSKVLGETWDVHLVGFKLEGGIYGDVSGEVSAGVRRGTQHAKDVEGPVEHSRGAAGWTGSEQDRPMPGAVPRHSDLDPAAMLNLLRHLFTARVFGELQGGLDYEIEDDRHTTVAVYVEGQLQTVIGLPIPLLEEILQAMPAGVGIGVRLRFRFEDDRWSETHLLVYQFSGEDDFFSGSANKQSFELDLGSLYPQQTLFEAFQQGRMPPVDEMALEAVTNAFGSVEIWTRFSLRHTTGARFLSFMRRRQSTRSLLSDSFTWRGSAFGLRIEPYLTMSSILTPPDLAKIADKVKPAALAAGAATEGEEELLGKLGALTQFLMEFEHPALHGVVDEILETVKVREAELRLQAGLGVGVAGKIGAGGQVRGDLSAEGGGFIAIDVIEGEERTLRWVIERLGELLELAVEFVHHHAALLIGPVDGSSVPEPSSTPDTPGPQDGDAIIGETATPETGRDGGEGPVEVRHLESHEDLPETAGRAMVTAYDLSSPTLTVASRPESEDDEHRAHLRFVFDGKPYSVDLRLGLRENDTERQVLVLVVLATAWMDDINFGFPEGEVFVVPYQRILPAGE